MYIQANKNSELSLHGEVISKHLHSAVTNPKDSLQTGSPDAGPGPDLELNAGRNPNHLHNPCWCRRPLPCWEGFTQV